MNTIQHFVNGNKFLGESKRVGKVFNPATGEQSAEVKLASTKDINDMLNLAKLPASGQTNLWDGRTGERLDRPVTVGTIFMLKRLRSCLTSSYSDDIRKLTHKNLPVPDRVSICSLPNTFYYRISLIVIDRNLYFCFR